MSHTKDNCDCPYSIEPIHMSRAKWVCPECRRDVSLEFLLLYEARNQTEK